MRTQARAFFKAVRNKNRRVHASNCPGRLSRPAPLWGSKWPGRGHQSGVGVVRNKRLHLLLALGPENRAGAVDQPPAGLEQRPQGCRADGPGCRPAGQYRSAGAASARRGGAARCPRRCRARPAGWRRYSRPSHQSAGWPASPTTMCACRPRRCRFCAMRSQRRGVDVQRGHVAVGQLQQVRGLAAGRGAGVQDVRRALARRRRQALQQQRRGQLGGGVLHRKMPFGKARQRRAPDAARARITPCSPTGTASIPASCQRMQVIAPASFCAH